MAEVNILPYYTIFIIYNQHTVFLLNIAIILGHIFTIMECASAVTIVKINDQ